MTIRRRTLVIGAVVLSGAALLLFCCRGADRPAENPGISAASSSVAERAVAPALSQSAAPNDAEPAASSPPAAPSASAATADARAARDGSAGTAPQERGLSIVNAVKDGDAHDLELLANAERELKADPPAELRALITQRKHGASRDELLSSIRALSDLRLRVVALRWLDQIAPAGDAGAR